MAETFDPNVKYEGTKIKLGGSEYIVPALSLGQLQKLEAEIEQMRKPRDLNEGLKTLAEALPVIHAALSRNYPGITKEELLDALDLNNYRAVINAVMGVSGLLPPAGAPPGEAVPGRASE